MGKPLPQRPHVPRPSPLQQVHLTRPLSVAPPTNGLVRDPHFWKRFSLAVHGAEAASQKSPSSSGDTEDEWLVRQHKKKRRCRIMCASITLIVLLVILAAAVVGYYFTKVRKI